MGLFALALPSLLLGDRVRRATSRSYDPEKAARNISEGSSPDDPPELDHDSFDDQDHDVLTTNTPHRRIRRVYSNVTRAFSDPANASSDDLPLPSPSLLARVKAYIWPSSDHITDLDSFVPNYRWTPIISGIVIPFSILLEIPGLTERWYIRTEHNKTVETQPNPVILDVGMAVSITCALIANVALVLRFLEKRVQTVTLLCIVFLTIHDIINIIAVTIFGVEHRFDDGFTYGDAFWMTLCSTIASTVTNVSLIVDFARTPDFAKRGSGLTRKQRALMIIVIVLLVYIALGALINSLLLHLSFINGLYFTVVSIETIGFGDIAPHSTAARVWTCFYVSGGVVNIGVAIAMCRETILEGLEIGYRRRVRDMRERRREARRFRRWETRWQRAVEFRLREVGLPLWVPDEKELGAEGGLRDLLPVLKPPFFRRVGTTIKRTATMTSMESVFGGHRGQHLNVEALTLAQLEEAALEAGVPLEMFFDVGDPQHIRPQGVGAEEINALPVRPQSDSGTAHSPHPLHGMSSSWPSHPQTPTHAQVGRMAAVLTKFAVAVSGVPVDVHGTPNSPVRDRDHAGSISSSNSDEVSPNPQGHRPIRLISNSDFGKPVAQDHRPVGSLLDIRNHPAAKWLKDFSRNTPQRAAWTYEKFRADMEAEEKKAYYVKLTIAWLLFFVFWTVGSGIFCVTEGWSYGTAMYFCFVAFSTTGYGDYSPQTPAGRSVFVVWALFGVGTLTILASVLQEAGSSRYRNALHSHVFDKAVKKYRKKQLQDAKQRPRPILNTNIPTDKLEHASDGPSSSTSNGHKRPSDVGPRPTVERLHESQESAQRVLEALPHEIVRNARTLQDYMQFFVAGATEGTTPFGDRDAEADLGKTRIPPDVKKLLDELGEMEGINDSLKGEILQDEDARKTLFMLSLERSLSRLVASAEKAVAAVADRDALAFVAAPQRQQSRHYSMPSTLSLASDGPERDEREGDGGDDHHVRAHSEPPADPRHRHVRHASIIATMSTRRAPLRERSTSRTRAYDRSPPRRAVVGSSQHRDIAEDGSSTSSTYAVDG